MMLFLGNTSILMPGNFIYIKYLLRNYAPGYSQRSIAENVHFLLSLQETFGKRSYTLTSESISRC